MKLCPRPTLQQVELSVPLCMPSKALHQVSALCRILLLEASSDTHLSLWALSCQFTLSYIKIEELDLDQADSGFQVFESLALELLPPLEVARVGSLFSTVGLNALLLPLSLGVWVSSSVWQHCTSPLVSGLWRKVWVSPQVDFLKTDPSEIPSSKVK